MEIQKEREEEEEEEEERREERREEGMGREGKGKKEKPLSRRTYRGNAHLTFLNPLKVHYKALLNSNPELH